MKKSLSILCLLVLTSFSCGIFGSAAHEMGPTAQPVWEIPATADINSYTYANGIFYALDSQLTALDEATGNILWQSAAESYHLSEDAKLIYVLNNGACSSLDSVSGQSIETFSADQSYLCDWNRFEDNASNFTLNDDGSITAVDAVSGNSQWNVSLGLTFSAIFYYSPGANPYVWDGRVIAYTNTFHEGDQNTEYMNFQALDPATGEQVWGIMDKPFGQALIAGDKVILAYEDELQAAPTTSTSPIPSPTGPFQLSARNIATGDELWHVVTEPATAYYDVGNTLYQCSDGNWRWFDMQTGQTLGEQKSVASSYTYSCPNPPSPISPDIQVGDDTWLVYGTRTSKDNTNFENPIQDGWYTAFQISTGKAIWSTDIVIHGAPSLVALGKSMVLMVEGDKLRAYSLKVN